MLSTNGTMRSRMYCNIVSLWTSDYYYKYSDPVVGEWDSWVTSCSLTSKRGGKISPFIFPHITAIVCLLSCSPAVSIFYLSTVQSVPDTKLMPVWSQLKMRSYRTSFITTVSTISDRKNFLNFFQVIWCYSAFGGTSLFGKVYLMIAHAADKVAEPPFSARLVMSIAWTGPLAAALTISVLTAQPPPFS